MIVVTGGAGFIGANLIEALQDRGSIALCDWFGVEDKWKNVRHAVVDHFIAPEELKDFLAEHAKSVSAIFHLGAVSATTERDVDLIVRSNLQLGAHLWRFAAKRGIPFIYASSAATYGNGEFGFDDRSDPDYLSKLRPLNPYGWSKLAFDRMVLAAIARGEPEPPQWAGLKFFNVYGPRERHKGSMRSVITSSYDQLRAGNPLKLFKSNHADYADGEQKRDFVFVRDCVDIMLWMLDHRFKSDLYNVGTGVAATWLDAGRAMFDSLGIACNIEFFDMPAHLAGKYQYFTEANVAKLTAIGAPVPRTSLSTGVRETYCYLAGEVE